MMPKYFNEKTHKLLKKADDVILETEVRVYEDDKFMAEIWGDLKVIEAEEIIFNYQNTNKV